jgi:lysophospholipid acyltransferase (LPLAT)-like uncharacterized protein
MFRKILPYVIWAIYRLWTATWRVREVCSPEFLKSVIEEKRPVIFAFWHGDELGLLRLQRRYRIAAMVSTSKDGEMMAKALDLLGVKCSRGSSTRGGATGLVGLLRLAKQGRIPVIAVDGPRGPYHKVKPGIFALSTLLDAEIIPVGIACSRAIVFRKSWNQAYLPLPFAKIQAVWGRPRPAIGRGDDVHQDELAVQLEASLEALGRAAVELMGKKR